MMVSRQHRAAQRERAAAARRRLFAAAKEAFLELGYHGATMGEIARRAKVAVQTVSYHFGSKPRLLSELLEYTVNEHLETAPPLERDEWLALSNAEGSGAEVIDVFVDGAHPIFTEASGLMDVARIGGLTDEEVAEIHRRYEQQRRRDFDEVTALLAARDALRPDLSPQRATDVALTTFSPQTYVALTSESAWTAEEIPGWMKDALKRLLLPCDLHAGAAPH